MPWKYTLDSSYQKKNKTAKLKKQDRHYPKKETIINLLAYSKAVQILNSLEKNAMPEESYHIILN